MYLEKKRRLPKAPTQRTVTEGAAESVLVLCTYCTSSSTAAVQHCSTAALPLVSKGSPSYSDNSRCLCRELIPQQNATISERDSRACVLDMRCINGSPVMF
jgi:hypothetical protein